MPMALAVARLAVVAFLLAVTSATQCIPDGVLDVLRFPCTRHHRHRFNNAHVTQSSTNIDDVGRVMYRYLTILITRYRSRYFISERVIQRTNAVPVFQEPTEEGGRNISTIRHAAAVYFVELHMMQLTERRLRVELYEARTYEGVIRICQQALVSLLCRLDTRLAQEGSPDFQTMSMSSLEDVTCPETNIIKYMAKSIHTLENIREYFRFMAMI